MRPILLTKICLLLIDIQNDFLPPSGSLAVSKGRDILPAVYKLLDERHFDLIVASQVCCFCIETYD
jgi:nicotinamidase-related amidase